MYHLHLGSNSEFIQIVLPSSFSDEGWAQAEVEISVNCFRGTIYPYFEAKDFTQFFNGLTALHQKLEGCTELSPLEGQFYLAVVGNGRGQISVSGEAWSQAKYENKLEFTFELDQTFLVATINQLEQFLYPTSANT